MHHDCSRSSALVSDQHRTVGAPDTTAGAASPSWQHAVSCRWCTSLPQIWTGLKHEGITQFQRACSVPANGVHVIVRKDCWQTTCLFGKLSQDLLAGRKGADDERVSNMGLGSTNRIWYALWSSLSVLSNLRASATLGNQRRAWVMSHDSRGLPGIMAHIQVSNSWDPTFRLLCNDVCRAGPCLDAKTYPGMF